MNKIYTLDCSTGNGRLWEGCRISGRGMAEGRVVEDILPKVRKSLLDILEAETGDCDTISVTGPCPIWLSLLLGCLSRDYGFKIQRIQKDGTVVPICG